MSACMYACMYEYMYMYIYMYMYMYIYIYLYTFNLFITGTATPRRGAISWLEVCLGAAARSITSMVILKKILEGTRSQPQQADFSK